jgi:iron(III) transport system ATP-binding protein
VRAAQDDRQEEAGAGDDHVTQLAVTGLHKAFGDHPVLTGLDLEVPAGSLTAILGPSGSGKTTLLRVLAGFERADAGTVTIGGRAVDGPAASGRSVHVPPERRRIGYVPQEGSLFPHLTVAANVGFGLPGRRRRGSAVSELLAAVGLAGLGGRYPHQLSGGQQQRVALARALAIRPHVVLLDEPFASLDAHLRASVRADVLALLARTGTTAVLVTHDQDEALSTADLVAVLRDGRIAQCAAPQELYSRPADANIARFIGDANLIEGVLDDGTVDTILGRLRVETRAPAAAGTGVPSAAAGTGVPSAAAGTGVPSAAAGTGVPSAAAKPAVAAASTPASGRATVLVRPEQVELVADPTGGPTVAGDRPGQPAGAELTGHVVAYGYHGHDAVVEVRPEHGDDAPTIIVRTLGGPQLPHGSPVRLRARGPVLAWPHP